MTARRTVHADRFSTGANALMLAALALGSWVALNGVVYQQIGLEPFNANNSALEFVVWYVPECSVLWWPFASPRELMWKEPLYLFSVVVGFLYLAAPVIATLGKRVPGQLAAGWRLLRSGPRLRI